jgi:hypothetical protein
MAIFAFWLLAHNLTVDDFGVVFAILAESVKANVLSCRALWVNTSSFAWSWLSIWEAFHASSVNEVDLLWTSTLRLDTILLFIIWSCELSTGLAGAV